MNQFPDCPQPYHFGAPTSHSAHSMSPSSVTGYSPNRFHEYHGAIRAVSATKAPIIGNLTTLAPTSRPVSRAPTPKVHTAEHKTSSSSANVPPASVPLFESLESDIKSYITSNKDLSRPLQYELSWEDFLSFREQAKKSVPGWEKLQYVIALIRFLCQCIDLPRVLITRPT